MSGTSNPYSRANNNKKIRRPKKKLHVIMNPNNLESIENKEKDQSI